MIFTMLNRTLLLAMCLAVSQTGMAADASKTTTKMPQDSRPIPASPPARDVPIDPKLQAAAQQELNAALASGDRIVRGHALEAAPQLLGDKIKDEIIKGLGDTEPNVRFAAAMAVGDVKLASAKNDVLKLLDDNDPHVRIAVRYALHRLGDVRFSHDLERTAIDPDPSVRGDTALVLGKLETSSAIKLLNPMLRDSAPSVRLQVAEALWKLGDERGLQNLVAASVSAYPEDVIISYGAIAASKNPKLQLHVLAGLTNEYPEIALAAARALGDMGTDVGYGVALQGAKSREPRQRYMAALALGAIGRSDAQDVLASMLQDKDFPDIRLAAAYALLQLGQKK
jgi:HEAT repeat protein